MPYKIFEAAALCDGRYFDEKLEVGESIAGSDGTTLTFGSDCETVVTPVGKEWFNSVRGEDRFKAYVGCAKKLAGK